MADEIPTEPTTTPPNDESLPVDSQEAEDSPAASAKTQSDDESPRLNRKRRMTAKK